MEKDPQGGKCPILDRISHVAYTLLDELTARSLYNWVYYRPMTMKMNLHIPSIPQGTEFCHRYLLGCSQTVLPVLIGDDASFHFLVILANANSEPGAQFSIVQGIHDPEHLAFIETKSIRRFLLVFKVGSDIERISHI